MTPRHRYATRLNSFCSGVSDPGAIPEVVRRVAGISGLSAVELNYPQHFVRGAETALIETCRQAGLTVTGLNVRFDGTDFRDGALTHPISSNRERAIALCEGAVDFASAHSIDHVVVWPGPDGFDYPFQIDYSEQWTVLQAGVRRLAERNPAIRISIEYKPSDPRRVSLIRSMSDTLLLVSPLGYPNLGATIDFCHSLMAGEHPAAAAALALKAGRLFGVHLNDGFGSADDGLIVGSVHSVHTIELLWVLRRHHYQGTIYFDTFPTRIDPAEETAANIHAVERMERALDRIDPEILRTWQSQQVPERALALINQALAEHSE